MSPIKVKSHLVAAVLRRERVEEWRESYHGSELELQRHTSGPVHIVSYIDLFLGIYFREF